MSYNLSAVGGEAFLDTDKPPGTEQKRHTNGNKIFPGRFGDPDTFSMP